MRKHLLAFALALLFASPALASGSYPSPVFQGLTLNGVQSAPCLGTNGSGVVGSVSCGSGGGSPGGSTGQIQYNNGGSFGGFTPGGDVSFSEPNFTVVGVHGVAYPATPSTNTVPIVTAPNTVTYEQVPNAALANDTISGIALGNNLDTLTFGTHLAAGGASYNGASNVTISTDATNADTASTIVARDASGNFSAGTITASLTGGASLDLPLSALGTNVQTALGNALNATGGIVGYSGQLGTPTQGVLTQATGLPLSTGISGLGSNVSTALADAINADGGVPSVDGSITTGHCLEWGPGVEDAGAACGSGGGGSPGGSNTDVQSQQSGAFYGDSGFTYNDSTHAVAISGPLTANGVELGGNGAANFLNPSGSTLILGVAFAGGTTIFGTSGTYSMCFVDFGTTCGVGINGGDSTKNDLGVFGESSAPARLEAGRLRANNAYTVSTLPNGSSTPAAAAGEIDYVTDQTTACPAPGAALTGAGSVVCPVFYNGSGWVSL